MLIQKYLQGKLFLLGIVLFLIMTNFVTLYFLYQEKQEECICEACPTIDTEEVITEKTSKIKVDLKGYVKNPGVYELEEGAIVNDLIELAGGLKTDGTTENINLSKKLLDEDMIVILSKSELKKMNTTKTVVATPTTSTSKVETQSQKTTSSNQNSSVSSQNEKQMISLNKASKEELMTLSGIGETKALSIIEYRTKTPFKDIAEIMNVSGIGESTYEKIKDSITI